MARNAAYAPAHTVLQRNASGNAATSPDAAASVIFAATAVQDHRLPFNRFNNVAAGSASPACQVLGWLNDGFVCTVDAVPATATVGAIAAAANVTSGTAMTLVSATGAGITVNTAAFTCLPFFNVIPATALVIGANPGYLRVGTRDITAFYDPTTMLSRAVSVTGSASSTGGNMTVLGYDVYGQVQSEVIAAPAGASTVNGKKAFKWITSVTPAFTDAHNYSVGLADIYGLNLAADRFAYTDVYFNDAIVTATGFVAADATSPATTTTGDVRGTVTGASNGTKRLQIFVVPSAARVAQAPSLLSTGLFGVVPV
jgi:hypothetical protein